MLLSFPPCTDVAASGTRWFRDKGIGALIHSLQLVRIRYPAEARFFHSLGLLILGRLHGHKFGEHF